MVSRQSLLLVVVLLTSSTAASWTSDASSNTFATSMTAKDAKCKQHDHMSVLQLGTTRASSQHQTRSNTLAVAAIVPCIPAVILALLGAAALFLVYKFVVDASPVPYTMALGVYSNFQDKFSQHEAQ